MRVNIPITLSRDTEENETTEAVWERRIQNSYLMMSNRIIATTNHYYRTTTCKTLRMSPFNRVLSWQRRDENRNVFTQHNEDFQPGHGRTPRGRHGSYRRGTLTPNTELGSIFLRSKSLHLPFGSTGDKMSGKLATLSHSYVESSI